LKIENYSGHNDAIQN